MTDPSIRVGQSHLPLSGSYSSCHHSRSLIAAVSIGWSYRSSLWGSLLLLLSTLLGAMWSTLSSRPSVQGLNSLHHGVVMHTWNVDGGLHTVPPVYAPVAIEFCHQGEEDDQYRCCHNPSWPN